MTKYIAKKSDDNGVIHFTDTEHKTWQKLIARQRPVVENYACQAFLDGLGELQLSDERIPQISELNHKLQKTGWTMTAVDGTIGVTEFFQMLQNRQFPVATFIRTPEELDYLKQPDIFHEMFGHAPLLMHPVYADFIQWYGSIGSQISKQLRPMLSRLFWYTIEFGLINTEQGLKVYGGGILSSFKETIFSVDSDEPVRLPYNMEKILSTAYDYANIQPHYFMIDSWDVLYDIQKGDSLVKALKKLNPEEQLSFIIC
jgi:phenylalanine-4-hydroxylase